MNSSEFSCWNDVSRDSVTHDAWSIYEPFQYGIPAVSAVLIVFFLIAFTWNLFIIISMLWRRLLNHPAHILLFNLAITDFLVSILVMPFTITSGIALEYVFGESDHIRCLVCQTGIVFTILSSVSLHNIALLSLDRFLFIYLPLKYSKLVTTRRTIAMVIAVWILCIVLSIPPLFGFGEVKLSTSVGNCFLSFFGETGITKNIYYIILLLLEALISIIILIITNVWLLCIVNKHVSQIFKLRKNLSAMEKVQQQRSLRRKIFKKHNRQQVQLLRVFGALFLANLVTWLPAIGLAISAPFVNFDKVPAEVIAFVYITYISHTVIHPILESCFIFELRDTITRCFTCGRKHLEPPPEFSGSFRRGSNGSFRRGTSGSFRSPGTQGLEGRSSRTNFGREMTDDGTRKGRMFSDVCLCVCLDTCSAVLLSGGDVQKNRQLDLCENGVGRQSPVEPSCEQNKEISAL